MFDRMVDVVTAAANLARFREPGRQFETCLPQVEPAELGQAAPAPLHEVAAPLEIRNEAFLAEKLQRDAGRDAAANVVRPHVLHAGLAGSDGATVARAAH